MKDVKNFMGKEVAIHYPQKQSEVATHKAFGFVHINYGPGVGKTTRAVGLAIRAAGEGLRVAFVQFLKSGDSGEVKIFESIPNLSYRCPGKHPFILSQGPKPVHYEHAETALSYALESVERQVHLLVCDEVLDTLLFELLKKKQILALAEQCRDKGIELVMTGRSAPPELIEIADYVTEFQQVRHPYYKGVKARKGIEY